MRQRMLAGIGSPARRPAAAAAAQQGSPAPQLRMSLGDAEQFRRELLQQEGLLRAYQAENEAAMRRIKVAVLGGWGAVSCPPPSCSIGSTAAAGP